MHFGVNGWFCQGATASISAETQALTVQLQLVKVVFPLEDGEAPELMYASHIAGNRFRLDNSPFYKFGISYQDEFFTDVIDGDYAFAGISRRGGHSTYRVKIPIGVDHEYLSVNLHCEK